MLKVRTTVALVALALLSVPALGESLLNIAPVTTQGNIDVVQGAIQVESARSLFNPVGALFYDVTPDNPNNYNMKLDFTLHQGSDSIGVIVPVGDRYAQIVVGGWGRYTGVNAVDGHELNSKGNPTQAPSGFVAGQRSRLEIDVNSNKIVLNMNGKQLSSLDYTRHEIGLIPNIVKAIEQGGIGSEGVGMYVLKGRADIHKWDIND